MLYNPPIIPAGAEEDSYEGGSGELSISDSDTKHLLEMGFKKEEILEILNDFVKDKVSVAEIIKNYVKSLKIPEINQDSFIELFR